MTTIPYHDEETKFVSSLLFAFICVLLLMMFYSLWGAFDKQPKFLPVGDVYLEQVSPITILPEFEV